MGAQRGPETCCSQNKQNVVHQDLVHRPWFPTPSGHSGGGAERMRSTRRQPQRSCRSPGSRASLLPPPGIEGEEIFSVDASNSGNTTQHSSITRKERKVVLQHLIGGRLWAGTQYHLQETTANSVFHGGSWQAPGWRWEFRKQELRGNSVWPQSPLDGWWRDEGQEAQPWWIRQRFRDLPKADVSEKLLLLIMNPDCPHKWFGTEPFGWPLLALPSWKGDSETSLFPYFDLLQCV